MFTLYKVILIRRILAVVWVSASKEFRRVDINVHSIQNCSCLDNFGDSFSFELTRD